MFHQSGLFSINGGRRPHTYPMALDHRDRSHELSLPQQGRILSAFGALAAAFLLVGVSGALIMAISHLPNRMQIGIPLSIGGVMLSIFFAQTLDHRLTGLERRVGLRS